MAEDAEVEDEASSCSTLTHEAAEEEFNENKDAIPDDIHEMFKLATSPLQRPTCPSPPKITTHASPSGDAQVSTADHPAETTNDEEWEDVDSDSELYDGPLDAPRAAATTEKARSGARRLRRRTVETHSALSGDATEASKAKEEEPTQCWLCKGTDNRSSNPLLRGVCRCSGSAGVVHQKCIDDLVLKNRYKQCSICRWTYQVESKDGVGVEAPISVMRQIRIVLTWFVLPLLWRVLKLVIWVIFSYIWIPFEVGSIFYREALLRSREATLPPAAVTPFITFQRVNAMNQIIATSEGNRTITNRSTTSSSSSSSPDVSWWWWCVYAWTLGTLIGAVIRAVLFSWDFWRCELLESARPRHVNVEELLEHLNEAAEQEEEELAESIHPLVQGVLREVFELVRNAGQCVGYGSIAKMSLFHVVVGSAFALVLSTRHWAVMLALLFFVVSIWDMYVPRRQFQDKRRMIDEMKDLKRDLTEMDVFHLFGMTVLRFAGIIFSRCAAALVVHCCLAPFFCATSTPQGVLEEITILRVVLYLACGVCIDFCCSLFDQEVTCGLFASGVDLFIFHSSQYGDEVHEVFVEAIALRCFCGGPVRVLLATLFYGVVLCFLTVLFFVLPLMTAVGARHVVFGDEFVTYDAKRGAPLFGLVPQRYIGPLTGPGAVTVPQQAGEVALPMNFGFPLSALPRVSTSLTLLQWVIASQRRALLRQQQQQNNVGPEFATHVSSTSMGVLHHNVGLKSTPPDTSGWKRTRENNPSADVRENIMASPWVDWRNLWTKSEKRRYLRAGFLCHHGWEEILRIRREYHPEDLNEPITLAPPLLTKSPYSSRSLSHFPRMESLHADTEVDGQEDKTSQDPLHTTSTIVKEESTSFSQSKNIVNTTRFTTTTTTSTTTMTTVSTISFTNPLVAEGGHENIRVSETIVLPHALDEVEPEVQVERIESMKEKTSVTNSWTERRKLVLSPTGAWLPSNHTIDPIISSSSSTTKNRTNTEQSVWTTTTSSTISTSVRSNSRIQLEDPDDMERWAKPVHNELHNTSPMIRKTDEHHRNVDLKSFTSSHDAVLPYVPQWWEEPPLHCLMSWKETYLHDTSHCELVLDPATSLCHQVLLLYHFERWWELITVQLEGHYPSIELIVEILVRGSWWVAGHALRYPSFLTWQLNIQLFFLLCTSLVCLVSSPYHRLLLRQLRVASRWYGWLFGMEEYLFSAESTEALTVFLASSEDSELNVPNTPMHLLFVSRKDQIPPEKVPSYFLLRRIAFFMLYYPTVVLCVWQIPIVGAFLWASVTTQLLPLLGLSSAFVFAVWRPMYVIKKCVLKAVLLCVAPLLLSIGCLGMAITWIRVLFNGDVVASCVALERKTALHVVSRRHRRGVTAPHTESCEGVDAGI